jgi:hypothetical protein
MWWGMWWQMLHLNFSSGVLIVVSVTLYDGLNQTGNTYVFTGAGNYDYC